MAKMTAILLLLNAICQSAFGQTNPTALWQTWHDQTLHDTLRLGALQGLAFHYLLNDPDSARLIADVQVAFAREKALPDWEAKALNTIGLSYRFQSNYAKAFEQYERSLALLQKTGDRNFMAAVYGNMGDLYRLQSNFPKALDCISRSLALAEETGDLKKAAANYVSIATIYYDGPGNNNKSLEYLEKARQKYEALGDEEGLALVHGNLSSVFLDLQDNEKALLFLEKSLAYQEKVGDNHGAATLMFNRAMIYSNQGKFQAALSDFERVVTTFERIGDQEGLADTYGGIGDVRIQLKEYPAAIQMCHNSLQLAREMGSPNYTEMEACMCLSTAYQKQGKFKQAFEYLQQYLAVKDSLQQNETAQKLKKMEMERQSVADSLKLHQEKFLVELGHQKALRQKDNAMAWLLAVGLGVLALALGFWVRMLYFQHRANNLQSRSESLEKQQLLYEIALLRTQVNPHFLFNSLSILSSLVRVDTALSEQFIEQLSRSYRYILEQKELSLVTLRTEIEFIQSYFFLLKIRFEHKIDLQINLPDYILDSRSIAPLTLQLLIENAVKHNRMSLKAPLIVTVSVGDSDTLVVENLLQPRSSPVISTGIGLQNIVSRYALLTDRPVWAGETEQGSFVVRIPFL